MQVGATLPQVGAKTSPETLVRAAQRAEELGYDSLWTVERLLYPLEPRSPYTWAHPMGCCRRFSSEPLPPSRRSPTSRRTPGASP